MRAYELGRAYQNFHQTLCGAYLNIHQTLCGHFKTLIGYWKRIILPSVFNQSSNYLISIVLPHSFKYQFTSLFQYQQWKTKMFM